MNREDALSAAADCVLRDRNKSYGGPEQSFGITAELWSIILRPILKEEAAVDPAQVALCLDSLKTARLIFNLSHPDSWVDKIGYSACGAEVATSPPAPEKDVESAP